MDKLQKKNNPAGFPYGDNLKQLFDAVYQNTRAAFILGVFKAPRSMEALGPNKEYLRCGNDVYSAKDRAEILTALDMRNAGLIMPLNGPELGKELKMKIDYYRGFIGIVDQIIQQDGLRNQYGRPLSVSEAFESYGNYRWEQVNRYDYREYRFVVKDSNSPDR